MKTTLALSMIVRDAERDLAKCLASAQGVVDEMVIADTGSRDSTIEIARQFGATVHSIPWTNDFSAARNRALEWVRSEWVLVLDADERLDPSARECIPRLLKHDGPAGYLVTIRNYLNSLHERIWDRPAVPNDSLLEEARAYPAYVEHENVRLFRRTPEIYFTGRVHETVGTRILEAGGELRGANFLIHHFGLATDADTRARKNQAYRELGWQKVKDSPANAQAHFEIGLMEFDVYLNDESALKCFETACRLSPGLSVAWFFAGLASQRLNQPAQAREFLLRAERLGHSPVLVKEALGDAYYNEGDFARAGKCYRKAIAIHGSAELQSKLGLSEVRQGRIQAGWARMREAAAEQPGVPDIHDRLIAAAVWAGDLLAAAQVAEQKLAHCEPRPEDFLRAASLRNQLQDTAAASSLLEAGCALFPAHERLAACLRELCAAQ